jgi:hypothetical protein
MVYDPLRHNLLLFGGGQSHSSTPTFDDWWTWNGSDWAEQSPGTPPPWLFTQMAYDEARREIVLLGPDGAGSTQTWTWDGAAWTLRDPTTNPSPAAATGAMAYDEADHEVVLFDNQYHDGSYHPETWTWNGKDWTQRFPTDSPFQGVGSAMAYDPDTGTIVYVPGEGGGQNTWTWSESTGWNKVLDPQTGFAVGAPNNAYAAMAYDPVHHEMVLAGGSSTADNTVAVFDCSRGRGMETYTWDGTMWTNEHCQYNPPPARWSAMIATDPATGTVTLFGGLGCTDPRLETLGYVCDQAHGLTDTWTWDGSEWVQQFPAGHPPGRAYGRMAFDSNGDALIFGGYAYDPGPDGASWAHTLKPSILRMVGKDGGTVETTNTLSPLHPLKTTVTVEPTQTGGVVSIAQTPPTKKAPAGFAFLRAQDTIKAPRGSPDSPLTLAFTLDPSLVAGDPEDSVTVFRTERGDPVEVEPCTAENPPTPDPCVASETTTPGDPVQITVLTTSASTWNFALPGVSRSLTIGYHHHRIFKGKLSSPEPACVAGQKVTVFRNRSGPDQKVGADVTSSTGVYKVRDANPKHGKYYASVPQHEEPSLGICEAAKSKLLRF